MAHDAIREAYSERGRAVSPVIGVILMVAISVILAAVIGAFVLEIGDRQETAPSTSFSSGEREVFLDSNPDPATGFSGFSGVNTTQVVLQHTGGENLAVSGTELRVEGHRDAWGVVPNYGALATTDGAIDDSVDFAPQPDFRRSAGTNDPVTIAAGDSMNVVAFDVQKQIGDVDGDGKTESDKVLYRRGTYDIDSNPAIKTGQDYRLIHTFEPDPTTKDYQCSGCTVLYFVADEVTPPTGSWTPAYYGWGPQLETDHQVDIVWQSQSGGKSQTLQSYTVQKRESGDAFFD
jgi:FlaG/FlaF family flagellin (archaellin)